MSKKISNKKDYVEVLYRAPLFRDFSREEVLSLLDSKDCDIRQYDKEEILHLQNEICTAMEVILEGKVVVQNIDENGNVLVIDTFGEGEIIGASLLFSSKTSYAMMVVASLPTLVLMMKKPLILDWCKRKTSFVEDLLREVSDKSILLAERINEITRKTIRQRILDFLMEEKERQNSNVIVLPQSKKELAERFGIPRSSLGRELIKMRKDGILEYDVRTITLLKKH